MIGKIAITEIEDLIMIIGSLEEIDIFSTPGTPKYPPVPSSTLQYPPVPPE